MLTSIVPTLCAFRRMSYLPKAIVSTFSISFTFLASLFLMTKSALAAEYPIGKAQIGGGMEVGAVYLQPVTMEPDCMMLPAAKSDIHLEADIQAVKNNPTGFSEGDWVPYLQIRYALVKVKTGQRIEGKLMPMVANDGPHYGDNVKLFGPGKYHLTYFISPPLQTGDHSFGRHIDKETGVGPWFKPFKLEYDFIFAGIGKKGGY